MAEDAPSPENIGGTSIHSEPPSPPLYLIRLSQSHESFRLPELTSLAAYLKIPLKVHDYSPTSPFCVVSFPSATRSSKTNASSTSTTDSENLAKSLISRSILSKHIYQFYATAPTYSSLHAAIKALPQSTWADYATVTFKFNVDSFRAKRSMREQREIVEGFGYLPLRGRIAMKEPEQQFVVSEEWEGLTAEECAALRGDKTPLDSAAAIEEDVGNREVENDIIGGGFLQRIPRRLFFGRYIGSSQRDLADKHDLKKRPYISTTSMDAELALVTALLAHAGPGRLMLDPFVGTGGFMVAAAELGAVTIGSDIDGRSFRGKGAGMQKGVLANFRKYGILEQFGDCITADLTNTPFRLPGKISRGKVGEFATETGERRWLDGIICDPPYGVREGLKVLGRRQTDSPAESDQTVEEGPHMMNGVPSYTLPGFIAPKRPYSFDRMLGDILDFAARILVDGGRLAFWMPCANEAQEEFGIPRHQMMDLKHICVQNFNRWSRRLLVYERIAGNLANSDDLAEDIKTLALPSANGNGHYANDLNQFRRMYFQGFRSAGTSTPKNENS